MGPLFAGRINRTRSVPYIEHVGSGIFAVLRGVTAGGSYGEALHSE